MFKHLFERTPAEGAVDVLNLQKFGRQRRLEYAGIIREPGNIGAALCVSDLRTKSCIWKRIRKIQRNGRCLEYRCAVMLKSGHLAERMRIGGIARTASITPADGRHLRLVRRADFFQQPQSAERARTRRVIEREHGMSLKGRRGLAKRAKKHVNAQGACEIAAPPRLIHTCHQRGERKALLARYGLQGRPE